MENDKELKQLIKKVGREEKIKCVINEIIKDISGRRGLGNEWETIDDDVQEEIKDSWKSIIKKYI
jgi:hypothetical protein